MSASEEKVYEIAIILRAEIDAHSLNNEGTVGNVTEPRTVALADGSVTDGISGEMLKHMHAKAFWSIVDKKLLCTSCQGFSPMKASANPEVNTAVKDKKSAEEVLKKAILCPLCDLHGFLIEKIALSRKSIVEFGWALALPEKYQRSIHAHSRVAPGEKKEERVQMLYDRPTRSGIYAVISLFQPWRIGFNEVICKYSIVNAQERKQRYNLAVDAYKAMFTRVEGAMTTTRLPHIMGCSGAIVISKSPMPVCVLSPLQENYLEETNQIAQRENFEVQEFKSLAEFLEKLDSLKKYSPYNMA
jgi:CRISPR-associated protein Cst2